MVTISACMIVKNEENNIEKCINSIKELVDEIVIVDTDSSDKTREIASKFTNKIFDFKWVDDFSAARNFSLEKASGDWILIIDADETISTKDTEKIKGLIGENEYEGYYLIQRNYTNNDKFIGWISSSNDSYEESKIASGFIANPIIRLFKNDKRIKFEGKVHETVDSTIKNIGKVKMTDIPLHHFGLLKQKEFAKCDRNLELLKKELESETNNEKEKSFIYFQIAMALLNKNEFKEAEYNLQKSLELDGDYTPALLSLSGIFIQKNELDKAEILLIRASKTNNNPNIYNNLGIIYAKKKDPRKAIKKFQRAIELNPKFTDAYFNLALAYEENKQPKESRECLQKIAEIDETYLKRG